MRTSKPVRNKTRAGAKPASMRRLSKRLKITQDRTIPRIKEAAEHFGNDRIFSVKEITNYINKKYPDTSRRRHDICAYMLHLSKNNPNSWRANPSVHQHAFLFHTGWDKYCLYDEQKHGEYKNGKKIPKIPTPNAEPDPVPETFDEDKSVFEEGDERTVTQTRRERNPELRKRAIEKYGTNCNVCGFDFSKTYGKEIGGEYIEVHHKKPLKDVLSGERTKLEDVTTVCSNCHRIIHRNRDKLLNMEEIRDAIKKAKG